MDWQRVLLSKLLSFMTHDSQAALTDPKWNNWAPFTM